VADGKAAAAPSTEGSAWDAEQLTNARIVVDVANELDLPDRAAVIGSQTFYDHLVQVPNWSQLKPDHGRSLPCLTTSGQKPLAKHLHEHVHRAD
jgi:hypothetical protein